ncbi:MAG: hypothetical protein AB7K71_12000 [Polyangiaceae bacterium]
MSEPDLERALTDDDYRESLVNSSLPLARFLRRAGAYSQAKYDEIDYTDWNGAVVGRGPGSEIRAAISPDPELPYTELAPLLELGTFARELVARHPTTPLAVLTKLANDEHWMVRNAITSRPDATAVFATLSPEVVARLKGAPAVPYTPPTYEELRAKVLTGDQATRCSVTWAASLPEDLMLLLAADPDHDVRRHLACREDITTAVTEALLAQACDGRLLQTLATNASLPTATLAALAQKEPFQEDRGPGWFTRRTSSPWPTSAAGVRALLAARSGLPSDWLETFARDADWQVRAAVAANPEAPEALLDSLLDDQQSLVRVALAKNPRFTSFELLATDPEPSVCAALARRADLAPNALELLARDANAGVRAIIASRKDTPRALLEILLEDSQAHVRQTANTALGAKPVSVPFNRVLQIRGVQGHRGGITSRKR